MTISVIIIKCQMSNSVTVEKEKSCVRQWSAPQFNIPRRIPSKLNLGNLGSSMFPG